MQINNLSNQNFGARINHAALVKLAQDSAFPTYSMKGVRVNKSGLRGFLRSLKKAGNPDTFISKFKLNDNGAKTMKLQYPEGTTETVNIPHLGATWSKDGAGRTIFQNIISALEKAEKQIQLKLS